MTGEPDKAKPDKPSDTKKPQPRRPGGTTKRIAIKAALILFALILSAFALLAGCKSEPPETGNLGYLYVGDDTVQFVEWTQEGMQIKELLATSDILPGGKFVPFLTMFDGVLDGENVSMITKEARPSQVDEKALVEKITGRLKGDTLILLFDGPGPKEFRRATHSEYAEASRKLETRAKTTKTAR